MLVMALVAAAGLAGLDIERASAQAPSDDLQPIELSFENAADARRFEATFYWGVIEVQAHDLETVLVFSRGSEVGAGDRTVLRPPGRGFSAEARGSVVTVVADPPETSRMRSLDLLIRVPRQVDLVLTMDRGGEIVVEGVEGGFEISTNNGSVQLRRVKGWASVDALNGSIVASFDEVEAGRSMSFGTLNGEVDLALPPSIDMDVRIQIQEDEILSELDLLDRRWRDGDGDSRARGAQRRGAPRRLEARLGAGGPMLFLSTHNGPITLRSSAPKENE